MKLIEVLLKLAEEGALYEKTLFTTMSLAKETGCSQQTMSNMLKKLDDQGYIERHASVKGIRILITAEGKKILRSYYDRLSLLFEGNDLIKGTVSTGMGQGKFYIRQKNYIEQFEKLLGYAPFYGTLNLNVEPKERNRFLLGKKPIIIDGFKTQDRSFGSLEFYHIRIGDEKAGLIVPKRTHHEESIVEIIAEGNLREKLGLKDGMEVSIHGI